MQTNLILAASNLQMPRTALFGYAWSNADLIIGDGEPEDGESVLPGGDGAYVVVQVSDEKIRIGTDYFGFGKVYLYRSGVNWAVGRSVLALADHAQDSGWALSRNHDQLQTWFLKGNTIIGGQLTSEQTAFNEISLVSQTDSVVIDGRASLRIEANELEPLGLSYSEALEFSLFEYCSRLKTLLDSDVPISSDITGGQDSRLILAGMLVARGDEKQFRPRVRFKSQPSWKTDFQIASEISKHYGFELNRPAAKSSEVDPYYALSHWREHDLGVYSAFYPYLNITGEIALNGCSPLRMSLKNGTIGAELKAQATDWLSVEALESLEIDALESIRKIAGTEDLRVKHYTAFRNRFHGGRPALRSMALSPLCMRNFYETSTMLPQPAVERAQIYADALFSLDEGLAIRKFDKPSKDWTSTHISSTTKVRIDSKSLVSGQIHGKMKLPPVRRSGETVRQYDLLNERFEAARPVAGQYLPSSYIAEAEVMMKRALDSNQSMAPVLGFVSRTILEGEIQRHLS